MLRFFYDTRYKYSNRTLIDVSGDTSYRDIDYLNIDTPDTVNGHIIYQLATGESLPTYILDLSSGRRWFVSGITPLSANSKFQISLLRDIMSESDAWKGEEAYVESGLATDFNKYKRWNLPFTNTKIKEQRLNFGGKSSFFVFYTNEQTHDDPVAENDYSVSMSSVPGANTSDYINVANLNDIPGYEYVGVGDIFCFNSEIITAKAVTKEIYYNTSRINGEIVQTNEYRTSPTTIIRNVKNSTTSVSVSNYTNGWHNYINLEGLLFDDLKNNVNNCKSDFGSALESYYNTYKTNTYGANAVAFSSISDLINNYSNKLIYCSGNIYKINYTSNSFSENKLISKNDASTLTSAISNINFPAFHKPVPGTVYGDTTSTFAITDDGYCRINYSGTQYNITIQNLGALASFEMNFTKDCLKLPKSCVRCVNIVSGADATVSDDVIAQALMLAQSGEYMIGENTSQIIDIQYLPFSIADSIAKDGNDDPYISINGSGQYATFLSNDDFQFFTDMSDLTDMNKETDTINIVSPSRGSQFLFRPYNNDGNMEFTTNVTIKPFASTIYVRPSTKGLLQYDWQDKDCLIINEDFSLTKVSSQWAEYVRSNKNYQRVFDRNLQSKEYERSWERQVEKEQQRADEYNARNAAFQEGKNRVGGLPIIGTISGLLNQGFSQLGGNNAYTRYMAAAQLDRQYNEAMYQESVALAQDQFNLQLENIKAQPLIPSTITTIDCKLLDGIYLEFYSTNPSEKKAIEDFYKYNGNRIDAFGRFSDYYGWYVKGKIIRSVNYTQPEIDEVNRRLQNGIFTEVQYD